MNSAERRMILRHDQCPAFRKPIEEAFPNAINTYDPRHIRENVQKKKKGPVGDLMVAMYADTREGFQIAWEKFAKNNPNVMTCYLIIHF
jgi:hypothetical protein